MDNYLIDQETLGKFVDELFKKKPMPTSNAEELNYLRTREIAKLDDRISDAIFGSLNDAELDEINQMFDRDEESPDVFRNFFKNAGVDVEQTITKTMEAYANEYLGGQNV